MANVAGPCAVLYLCRLAVYTTVFIVDIMETMLKLSMAY